jgi:hypothetical protein
VNPDHESLIANESGSKRERACGFRIMKLKLLDSFKKAWQKDIAIVCIGCALLLLIEIPLLTDSRPITSDEPWYTNPAYNFSQGQRIHNTNVGSGGDSNFMFPLIQGILFTIFGYSIFLARFASVLAGLVSIAALFKILKQLALPRRAIVFGLFALIAIPIYHSAFRFARPESWALLFVLLSLLFLIKHIQDSSVKSIFLAGMFCAFGFLTHPFTLSVSLAIGFVLLVQFIKSKRILPLIAFSIPLAVSAAIFILNFFYLLGHSRTYVLLKRVNSINTDFFDGIGKNIKLIVNSYVLGKNAIYFLPLMFLLALGLFLKKRNNLAFYSSIMGCFIFCASLALFSSSGFEMLMPYVLLFSIFDVAFIIAGNRSKFLLAVISTYLIGLLAANIYYDVKKYEPINSLLEKELAAIVPESAKIIGPIEFWMFLPKTQYKATIYRWAQAVDYNQLPLEFNYYLSFSNDRHKIKNKYFHKIDMTLRQYPGAKLVYETNSKNYGKIELFTLRKPE